MVMTVGTTESRCQRLLKLCPTEIRSLNPLATNGAARQGGGVPGRPCARDEEEPMKWLKYLLVIGLIAGVIVMVTRKQSA